MASLSHAARTRLLLYPLVLLAMFGFLRWFETAALFPAPSLPPGWLQEQARRQGARETTVTTEDGVQLYAWHIPAGGQRVLLWFDGNGASVGMREEEFGRFQTMGLDIVQVNYRGYPGSEGSPSEEGLRADARAAWALAEQVAPGAPIVLFGKSLGGGVAIGLAAERPAEALVVESTFSSVTRAATEAFPFLPVRLMLVNRFDSAALAPKVVCPTLILHGTQDEIVSVAHVDALAAAFPRPPQIVRKVGTGHNPAILLDPEVWPMVQEWVQGSAAPRSP